LRFRSINGAFHLVGYNTYFRSTSAVYRDPSAWYHVVWAVDTTQATAANRVKLYVNGVEVTAFSASNNPTQNDDLGINQATAHAIGSNSNGAGNMSGYLADIHFIDGQQLDPSSFTTTDLITGQLIPKAYSGSYGTNGFKLNFSDNSTTAALGTDTSGNGNTWTVNNLSVTAGSGNDSLVDTPTSYGTDTGVGGEVRGNYCTLNPLNNSATLSNGNLQSDAPTAIWYSTVGTIYVSSGKWYWEVTPAALGLSMIGVANKNINTASNASSHDTTNSYTYYNFSGNKFGPTSNNTGYGATYAANDVIGVALDLDNGTLVFYKNNTSQGTAYSGLTGIELAPFVAIHDYVSTGTLNVNFGQRAFAYTAPSGFKALVDTNLPTPVVAKGNTVMDVVLYTGTGAALTPTSSLGFNPDWIWIKSRSAATDHALYDVVRGAQARLESDTTDAEVTTDGGVTAFNSAGFTLGTLAQVNTSSATYAAWCWDAGTSTVTNTAGSISSQVRANASAGFSIVTYTGNATSGATVGHGLGVKPYLVIYKNRSISTDWPVYSDILLGVDKYLYLNTTAAVGTISGIAAPTSTVLVLPSYSDSNGSGNSIVAYAFAPVAGYSSFGSYTGNGSADGPFVYTGFKPKWLMIKVTQATGNGPLDAWVMYDAVRDTYNVATQYLYANSDISEGNYPIPDLLSNGFKIRVGSTESNQNNNVYIYAAFAESPVQFSRAR
jgi:hypothetical protein